MMAASMAVVVLCPNGRRQTVKVTLNTSILHVIEEACKKQGFNPHDYDIKHFKQMLDPSLTVRFANLPNNALLELCPIKHLRQDSSVTVALQLESGERLTENFNPSCTLWDIINHWDKTRNGEIMRDTYNGNPVCIYMRTEIVGESLLKQTSLRSLGLTGGKVVIRLLYRPVSLLGQQAHDTAPLTKRYQESQGSSLINQSQNKNQCTDMFSEEQMSAPYLHSDQVKDSLVDNELKNNEGAFSTSSHTDQGWDISEETNNGSSNEPEGYVLGNSKVESSLQDKYIETADVMDTSEGVLQEHEDNIIILGERDAIVFNLEDVPKLKQIDLPDDFFELTLEDARYLLNDLKRQRIALEEHPLETSSQREARSQKVLNMYHQTILRIHFPDRLVLQACFMSNETVKTVMEFIQKFLNQPHSDFYLYTAPPKTVLPNDVTLTKAHLVPAAVVHFGSSQAQSHYLKPEVRSQLSTLGAASKVASRSREEYKSSEHQENITPSTVSQQPQPLSTAVHNQPQVSQSEKKQNGTKVPRWFKLGQK